MRKNQTIYLLLGLVAFLLPCNIVHAQDYSKAFAAADTSHFSVNNDDGWSLFNSYGALSQNDSAILELILYHKNNIDWTEEQLVGKIKLSNFQPAAQQILRFNLMNDVYQLTIDDKGKCYLKFVSGTSPSKDPMIIPLKVFYKLH